ncbi:hydroxymethylpyrimidine/phosphomethylpyrimidine kinase [Flavobacterium gilvum]|uniref:hydroxymethylpyrimidine kinase n=1 Tax=Flavobacterium gilvum TaxID=1492737 RepID=A0AAC9I2N8_9FLAO|nr:hydroxymethylpyrimidine/phosphomethylpyrimidine kinase [Flavobacterium gilvum]AOW09121.1 hydroxymethylpyrimidine/phosphomethylpyrimidine kinase [Flavobacterium gilvum]KFC60233.1 hypothetical protein FEM08_09910 [Flavobacterium gilvum]
MSKNRPFVLTIAGFDPSAGAGVLADIKTFEQHRVQGFAINTGNTIQTENEFFEMQWTDVNFVLKSIAVLLKNYNIEAIKIGIVPSLDYLKEIVFAIKKKSSNTKIIWDTVLKSSTEFNFLDIKNQKLLNEILTKIDLITPNYNEMQKIFPGFNLNSNIIPSEVRGLLLKGGHNPNEIGVDYLHTPNNTYKLVPTNKDCYEKHGSGCVLSAAITANIALGHELKTACQKAKTYTENYLLSNPTKLGFHYV